MPPSFRLWRSFVALLFSASVAFAIPLIGIKPEGKDGKQNSSVPFDLVSSKIHFQDVNLVQLTDVHSWLSGHAHEPKNEASYANVLAFVQHLQEMAWAEGKDLFLFNTGDIVDGTGLSDASPVRGVLITPIIQQMPFAALTCGNHELYHNSTITNLVTSGFVDYWGDKYLTGNIHNASTGKLIGHPYTIVKGKMGRKLLVMGFLYNMENSCEAVYVEKVQEAIQQPWFKAAMREAKNVDAIVLLVHMDAKDPLTQTLRASIREEHPDASVIFLAGHTHVREFHIFDERCVSMESGKFLDTVGFMSCVLPDAKEAAMDCEHEFITPHVPTFMQLTHTDSSSFETQESKAMRADLAALRSKLDLDRVIGCSPADFDPFKKISDKHSMWELYLQSVLPSTLYPEDSLAVFVAGTGALRYKLFKGEVHLDDTYIVAPFKDEYLISHVAGDVLAKVIDLLLKKSANMLTERTSDRAKWEEWEAPWVASVDPSTLHHGVVYDLIYVEFDAAEVGQTYKEVTGEELKMEAYRQAEVDSRTVWEQFVRSQWPCAEFALPVL